MSGEEQHPQEMESEELPFHKSAVNALGRVNTLPELQVLVELIDETGIPQEHNEVIEALEKASALGGTQADHIREVTIPRIEKQRKKAGEKAAAKAAEGSSSEHGPDDGGG